MPRGILVIAKNGEKYDFSLEVCLYGHYYYVRGKGYHSIFKASHVAQEWLEMENRKNGRNQENAKIPSQGMG